MALKPDAKIGVGAAHRHPTVNIIGGVRSSGVQPEPSSLAARSLLHAVEARFADGLSAAREPAASGPAAAPGPGPGPATDVARLRRAYLDLLKLALCDLVATTTTSVFRAEFGEVMARELSGPDLRTRAAGMDWPLHGLTMLGLARLDDLQRCVERVVLDGIPGDMIEAGSWRGGAAMLMRATLDAHDQTDRTVWVADSFQGFPAAPHHAEGDGYDLHADLAGADFLAVPLGEVRSAFARLGLAENVNFVPGFFRDTLPALAGRTWSLVRLDGDTYDSVRAGLDALYPDLSVGGYVVIDDYHSLEECRAAVQDYRDEHGIEEPIEQIDWNGARWRRDRSPGAQNRTVTHTLPPDGPTPPQAVQRGPRQRVPALAEVELREELELVRQRLSHAEAVIDRLERSPLTGINFTARALLRRTSLAEPLRRARSAGRRLRAPRGDA